MPVSDINNDEFFVSCLKHAEVNWNAVCKDTGLTNNAAKKRWKRFIEKQGTAEGGKTPKQPGSAKKELKRAADEEGNPTKNRKKAKKEVKVKDKEDEAAVEDDDDDEDA